MSTDAWPHSLSDKCLSIELPLYTGSLASCIFSGNADILQDVEFMQDVERDTEWGRPLREPDEVAGGKPQAPCEDIDHEFWEAAPVFRF